MAIVGAGAAGLMAAIWARRSAPGHRVVVLDGARTLGAKILVAGGGRCNVTHDVVDETAFAGSSRPAIRKVLRRFGVAETIAFFREQGVALKREETGKLFPTTDRARTVLDALLGAARTAGVEVRHPWRVEEVRPGLVLTSARGETLEAGHVLRELSGLSAHATLEVRDGAGRRVASFTDSTLCTHFGLSGPAVLDVSRYLIDARLDDPGATLVANWLPGVGTEPLEAALRDPSLTPGRYLAGRIPERLARALVREAGVEWGQPGHQLTREARRALVRTVTEMRLPVSGDRGFSYAEVTAGGVPLAELDLATLRSRRCPGLSLCGEICDVDGRIGGFNFQWAWASGYVAGTGLA